MPNLNEGKVNDDLSRDFLMERKKVFKMDFKQLEGDSENFYFEGFASTTSLDRGRDIVEPGAFSDSIKRFNGSDRLPVLWQHDSSMPIGVFEEIEERSDGLFVKGRLPREDKFVTDRVIPQMRAGSISAMSIGFTADEVEYDGEIRRIKKIKDLFEISLVTIPMNPEARVTAIKAAVPFQDLPLADRDRSWDSSEAIQRVRDFTGSEDEPSDSYRRAFLQFDSDDADNFGAYKLPIADVIDGRLFAVPRAIFAAAAAIQGARGGVDISDEDRDRVISNINRYYSKMDLESPFEKGFGIDEIKSCQITDLKKMLRNGTKFVNSAASMLAGLEKGRRVPAQIEVQDDSGIEKRNSEIVSQLKAITKRFDNG